MAANVAVMVLSLRQTRRMSRLPTSDTDRVSHAASGVDSPWISSITFQPQLKNVQCVEDIRDTLCLRVGVTDRFDICGRNGQ